MTIQIDSMIKLPEFLNLPPQLMCLLDPEVIARYKIFIIEGGRGSAKTQSLVRILSYWAEQMKLRIVAGREQQNSIEDSVYAAFVDLILKHELFFDTPKNKITHKSTGSTIGFKGLREHGVVNIKGLEGTDIFWGEEAQSFSKTSLDILIPTLRKENSKFFFTLNRFVRNDPVMAYASRKDCLHININYPDNPYFPETLRVEMQTCKEKNIKDFNHIWLGQPLSVTTEYLFNFDKLAKCKDIKPFGDLIKKARIMSVDFASGGGDLCVASLIERTSNVHWKLIDQIAWDNPDTDESVGKVSGLYGDWYPDILICDKGGLGYPMFVTLSKTIKNIVGFDGAGNDKCTDPSSYNNRYQAYLDLKTWTDKEWINISSDYTLAELETIKKKYMSSGKMLLQSKKEAKDKDGVDSQDRGDSVSMAVYAAVHFLGKVDFETLDTPIGMRIVKKNAKKKRV